MASDPTDCPSGYYWGSGGCYRSHWYFWGRWVVLAAIAIVILITISLCTFLARRRRNRGLSPFYGTGWLAPQRQASQGRNGQSTEMNNRQRRADTEQQDAPPPVYDPQRLPAYTNLTASTLANDRHDKPELRQNGLSQDEEDISRRIPS